MVGGVDKALDSSEKLYRIRLFTFRGFVVLLVAVVLLSVFWISALVYDVNWVVRGVDEAAVTCCPAILETPTGKLLMTYGTTAGLILATQDDGAWSFSSVMESDAAEGAFSVHAAAVAVDDDEGVHIASLSYWPGTGLYGVSRLIYSERASSGWENTIVDEHVSTFGVSIAVDGDSNAHISYAKLSDWESVKNLTYATDSAGEWSIYDLSSHLPSKWDDWVASSICVDSAGRPHIASLTDFAACYVTNLSEIPVCAVIGWGNPWYGNIYPSRPSILVDSDDVVHVFCVNEAKETYDGAITKTVVHYSVSGGAGSYENTTISSDTDFSWDPLQTVMDSDGGQRIFYSSLSAVGVITLSDDGGISEECVHAVADRETRYPWRDGLSVVFRGGGDTIVSKPYGSLGYLTDSFTLSERLSTATTPFHTSLTTLAIISVAISVAVVFSRRSLIEEAKWHKVLDEREGD
jgi:hypothetical protein